MLSQRYQTEQQELAEKIERLNADLAAEQQSAVDAEKWVNLIKQYVNPTELTAELLNALIEKIVVHEAVKDESNTRTQEHPHPGDRNLLPFYRQSGVKTQINHLSL